MVASSALHMVWASDSEGLLHVREGIFPDFRLGTSWVSVPGLGDAVAGLCASDRAVYALTGGAGRVFKRARISER